MHMDIWICTRIYGYMDIWILGYLDIRKPWKSDGLYAQLWQPHCDRFADFLRAPIDDATVPEGAKEKAAQLQCSSVKILDDWSPPNAKPCELGCPPYTWADQNKRFGFLSCVLIV